MSSLPHFRSCPPAGLSLPPLLRALRLHVLALTRSASPGSLHGQQLLLGLSSLVPLERPSLSPRQADLPLLCPVILSVASGAVPTR